MILQEDSALIFSILGPLSEAGDLGDAKGDASKVVDEVGDINPRMTDLASRSTAVD